MTCKNCLKELAPVFKNKDSGEHFHYEDALEIQLDGGYGMYYDFIRKEEYEKAHFLLCKECTEKLIESFHCFKI